MSRNRLLIFIVQVAAIGLAILPFIALQGCKHDIPEPQTTQIDTTSNGGGNNGGNGLPCNPDSIYFDQQILPFLVASCGKIGCHDSQTHEDGVVINSYNTLTSTVEVLGGSPPYAPPFNLSDSQLWEVLTASDPDDKMPPTSEPQLTSQQMNLISTWIQQGAQNLHCDDNLGPCDSLNVTYNAIVKPIIQDKCLGCHLTATSTNSYVDLSNYTGVAAIANTGQLVGCITYNPNYYFMPKYAPKLSNCEIGKIRKWVNDGAPNN